MGLCCGNSGQGHQCCLVYGYSVEEESPTEFLNVQFGLSVHSFYRVGFSILGLGAIHGLVPSVPDILVVFSGLALELEEG